MNYALKIDGVDKTTWARAASLRIEYQLGGRARCDLEIRPTTRSPPRTAGDGSALPYQRPAGDRQRHLQRHYPGVADKPLGDPASAP